MPPKNLSELTDQELLQAAQQQKKSAVTHALFIGFLAGIILYSAIKNTWGFFTLIPLYLIYLFTKKPSYNKQELEQLLKERNLK